MSSMPFKILRKHRIILGNLPLLGISYQGITKDNEYKERFRNKAETKKVIRTALNHGVKFFAASSQTFNSLALNYINVVKEIEVEDKKEIWLIPCIDVPLRFKGKRVDDYQRWKTHLEYEIKQYEKMVLQRYIEDPILNCRQGWKEGLNSAKPFKHAELVNDLGIDWKDWEVSVNEFSNYNLGWIEPGSGTDFLAISRMDLLEELLDKTSQMGHRILLGSHHIGISHQLISNRIVKGYDGFITPVNKLGAMMFPTQKTVETAIANIKKQGKLVVAIKPFAGGRISPEEALPYVFKKVGADACMVGVGSAAEAEIDIQVAEKVLASLPFRSR